MVGHRQDTPRRRALTEALDGVPLIARDKPLLAWLSGQEPGLSGALADLILRARAAERHTHDTQGETR